MQQHKNNWGGIQKHKQDDRTRWLHIIMWISPWHHNVQNLTMTMPRTWDKRVDVQSWMKLIGQILSLREARKLSKEAKHTKVNNTTASYEEKVV